MGGRSHLVLCPGERFGLWRWAALRGAGFPADLVGRLAAPELARRIDALLEAEEARAAAAEQMLAVLRRDRAEAPHEQRLGIRRARRRVEAGKLPTPEDVRGIAEAELDALRGAAERVAQVREGIDALAERARQAASRVLAEAARDPRFREAVTWQNRQAVRTALDSIARRTADSRVRSRERTHENLVANYLHRYCTKNDTIGFFGPVGWARFDGSAKRMALTPAPRLIASRAVFFEQWGIDALAERISRDPRFRPWIPPRRYGFVRLEGAAAFTPMGNHDLPPALELVLRACDGITPARDVAAALVARAGDVLPDEASVFAALDALREKQLVAWDLSFGTTWQPDRKLRALLERIGDPELRAEALAPLEALEDARLDVAQAAGDPERLSAAFDALEATFTRMTGASGTRDAGKTYAARALVFEDCRRDVDIALGDGLLDDIGPALSLVLTSARWFTFELARAYEAAFRAVYDTMIGKSGSPRVPFSDFWFRVQRLLHGAKGRPLDAVASELRARWDPILRAPNGASRVQYESAELRPKVEAAFDAPFAGWATARQHSPDVMICAPSVEAIERGDYLAVLGEVHVAWNTLETAALVAQHPAPEELVAARTADVPEPVVYIPQSRRSMGGDLVRTVPQLSHGTRLELETGFDPCTVAPERVVPLGDLELSVEGGSLVVSSSDGRLNMPLMELVGPRLGVIAASELTFGSDARHAPRITVDRLVIQRESWTALPSELTFAYGSSEVDLFVGARRWARSRGLPRFVFVKSPHEVKPMFVDFDSVIGVRIFARAIRAAKEHVSGERLLKITEMLPALDDLWLTDHDGRRYTAEIRFVAADQKRPRGKNA